jgi:uncharacterized protein GlcG (DUF336 family)
MRKGETTMRMFQRLSLIAGLVALPALPAAAEDFTQFRVMSPDLAQELARATLADCRGRGFQVAVAVTDRFGVVQVVLRDSLAGQHTPDTAVLKARTAVSFRTATEELAEATQSGSLNSAIRHIPGFLFLGGGVPVEAAGSIVGGIGVSGGPSGGADQDCARAGIAAIEDRLLM